MDGFFLTGIYISMESRQREDGKLRYMYLIAVGTRSYRVSSENYYELVLGDAVTFEVRPNVYNGSVYYSGDLIDGVES